MTKDGDASSVTSHLRSSPVARPCHPQANLTSTRWFSVTMGTGIVSILLHNLPYNGVWIYWISVVIFALNVLLFSMGCIMSILRYTLYPEVFHVMIMHPVQSMFIGTVPMGLATIVNMFVLVCVPVWGEWARYFAWGLWIFDAIISVMTALSLPFVLSVHPKINLQRIC
jgi:tellurite resistance protein TehA-like permease